MYDVSTASVPICTRNLFTKTSSVDLYNTLPSTPDSFYRETSRLEIQKNTPRINAKLWYETKSSLRELPKKLFELGRLRKDC